MIHVDANKSPKTHAATAAAALWLDGLGCKPVESEVPLDGGASGWIADLASFWCPTFTEAKQSRLLKEVCPSDGKDRENFNWLSRSAGGRLTIVVEVKISRADFLSDLGRKYGTRQKPATMRPPAHLCVLACPTGVIGKDEYLENWATLRLSEDCGRVLKFEGGWYVNAQLPIQIEDLLAGVAIRRDHHTRYASLRRAMRAYRAGTAKSMYRRNGESAPC